MRKVFGYRPPSAGRSLLRNSEGVDEDEDGTSLEKEGLFRLRLLVREHVKGLHIFGMSKAKMEDLSSGWPDFYSFLKKNHGDILSGCTVVIKKNDRMAKATPYVMLPDHGMTVAFWDEVNKVASYSQSEDLARAIERFKDV